MYIEKALLKQLDDIYGFGYNTDRLVWLVKLSLTYHKYELLGFIQLIDKMIKPTKN